MLHLLSTGVRNPWGSFRAGIPKVSSSDSCLWVRPDQIQKCQKYLDTLVSGLVHISYFPHCCIKMPNQHNLEKEGFILAYSLGSPLCPERHGGKSIM